MILGSTAGRAKAAAAVVAGLLAAACARSAATPAPAAAPQPSLGAPFATAESLLGALALPPLKPVRGPLVLRVAYPASDAILQVRDSTFLFGSAGTGEARVTIDGQSARVWPNGAWLAYIALPPDSVMLLRVEARTDRDSVAIVYPVRRALPEAGRLNAGEVWLDSLSLAPTGRLWVASGEYVTLSARASEGAAVRLVLPDGTIIPLVPQPQALEVPAVVRAFERDTTRLRTPLMRDRYVGLLRGRPIGPDPGPMLPLPFTLAPADTSWALLEAIRGADTARTRWPLQIAILDTTPQVVELDDDPTRPGLPDSLTVGRALPGGTYTWFFPAGTRATAVGRRNDQLRLRLSQRAEAWVALAEARGLSPGGPAPSAVVGSVSVNSRPDRASVRIPIGQRVPFQVEERDRSLVVTVYGALGDVDWMRYGTADSLLRRMSWRQSSADEVQIEFELDQPVWGYRARWDRTDLLLEIRRPPTIDAGNPLRGRVIAVDAGHPPGGAIGPTGLREAEANLGVALELQRLLEDAGARVVMTRTSDVEVELWPRVHLAETENAEVLVSIHNNALPDGLNPFVNNGTSVYYNQPRSAPLARAIQAALLRRLGLRDLGFGRGDLALVRGTWMPSVLTEGLFMMFPDQEAALRDPEGRHRYAQGVVDGLRGFLEDRARGR